jgi:hypothetical protein
MNKRWLHDVLGPFNPWAKCECLKPIAQVRVYGHEQTCPFRRRVPCDCFLGGRNISLYGHCGDCARYGVLFPKLHFWWNYL